MTSFLQRSAQKTQLSPSKRSAEDVFSEFRSFRNETKRKAETSHSKLILESPQQSVGGYQPFASNSFVSAKNTTSQVFQLGGGFIPNSRHASNISPNKKATIGIQQHSPQKSYLYKENLHEQCQQHAQHNSQFNRSVVNPIASGLDNLQREIKEISFSSHFNHQINAARQQSRKKLANLSPTQKSNTPLISSQYSPARSSTLNLFGRQQNSKIFESAQQQQVQIPTSGLSSLYASSQLQNQSPFKRRNSQQPRSLNIFNQKVISYSPTRYSQKLFSPNRLVKRLGSPVDSQFQDFEYPATQNSPQINVKGTKSALTTQIPGSSSLGSAAFNLKRSNSASGNSLSQLLNQTKNKIKSNGMGYNLSPKPSFANRVTNNTQINLNNSSFLSPNSKNQEIFGFSKTAYLVDKRAHDLEDYLSTLSNSDFSSLPRENVESLIKLSSVIMSKVKGSTYYRGSIF
ncbi:hypothetical protein TTHERM_00204140 (macronuclear) [Tetrahymena thermophila SB210]|uniref:Uncharacterized protein n=1 Tax=Tetrahymena thermophila (strain SB210) TaxID=312017 RepID=Q22ND0_TETTS|nr:hypothetical protein TTHERM_00204140 [Tetrahymena thermophila SB210]EAR86855.1 hypothetical protein TTHERM_00204140 [Tetrahymena thermophila SB210]|eukprot:XP_001007100.1 hypothetical protein TTHERM_00204140 [Tetrahymena thermophila SB210]